MRREMINNPIFRKFALKLKREKLWNRFRILQYYFDVYCTESENSLVKLYDCLKKPSEYMMIAESHKYKVFDDGTNSIPIEKIFKYFRV